MPLALRHRRPVSPVIMAAGKTTAAIDPALDNA